MIAVNLLYKIHKRLAVFVCIPTLLWVFSGMSHPFMSNWFRPEIAEKRFIAEDVDTSRIGDLSEHLRSNSIHKFNNCRLIKLQQNYYYQLSISEDSLMYLNAETGQFIPDLDRKYAVTLARYFTQDDSSKIESVSLVSEFSGQYKSINRLLPVWKVEFARPDNMDVFVETRHSRLGTFNNQIRKTFLWVFGVFHTWDFVPGASWVRTTLVLFFSGVLLLTAVAGLWMYAFSRKRFNRMNNKVTGVRNRRLHRVFGLIFSVFVLLFSFSGFYHATMKFQPDERRFSYDKTVLIPSDLNLSIKTVAAIHSKPWTNFSLVRMDGEVFYRIESKDKRFPEVTYYSAVDGEILEDGDFLYAEELARQFYGFPKIEVESVGHIRRFHGEYGFINKRLPVVKVDFKKSGSPTFYIEPLSGRLAAKITDADRREGFSFSFLHKFSFLKPLGKDARDIILICSVFSIAVVTVLGLRLLKSG